MRKLVENNEITICTSDFTNLDGVIISTGGIIIGDISSLSKEIARKASRKKSKRNKKIDKYFRNRAYSNSKYKYYVENFDTTKKLIDILSELLYTNFSGIDDTYENLLDCLVESSEPIKSNEYEEKVKKLLQEYPNK